MPDDAISPSLTRRTWESWQVRRCAVQMREHVYDAMADYRLVNQDEVVGLYTQSAEMLNLLADILANTEKDNTDG